MADTETPLRANAFQQRSERPMNIRAGSTVVINVFTPKPNALDDFLALQIEALPAIRAAAGARGTRLLRAEDGSNAVMVSVRLRIVWLGKRFAPGCACVKC
jgi:hypothetical protein